MDPEAFLDIANQVVKLKMFPYFDIAHCTLCALSVREDLGTGERAFFISCAAVRSSTVLFIGGCETDAGADSKKDERQK